MKINNLMKKTIIKCDFKYYDFLKQCYLTLNALYLLRATAIHKLNAILKRGLLFIIFLQFRKSQ